MEMPCPFFSANFSHQAQVPSLPGNYQGIPPLPSCQGPQPGTPGAPPELTPPFPTESRGCRAWQYSSSQESPSSWHLYSRYLRQASIRARAVKILNTARIDIDWTFTAYWHCVKFSSPIVSFNPDITHEKHMHFKVRKLKNKQTNKTHTQKKKTQKI